MIEVASDHFFCSIYLVESLLASVIVVDSIALDLSVIMDWNTSWKTDSETVLVLSVVVVVVKVCLTTSVEVIEI